MKKIVALVLALVLALSLATVAFGSTNGSITNQPEQTGANWTLTKYHDGGLDASDRALTKNDKIVISTHGDDVDDDGVVTKYATKISINESVFFEVGESYATYKLSKGDVTYFLAEVNNAALNDGWLRTAKTATGTVSGVDADEAECGDYEKSGIVVKGTAYEKVTANASGYATTYWAVLNGKFVPYNGTKTVDKYPHTFTSFTTKNTTAGKTIIATVKCGDCDKEFKVVKSTGIDKDWTLGVNYVVVSTAGDNKNMDMSAANIALFQQYRTAMGVNELYAVLDETVGATNTSATTTTGVSSAKTFDAGVALYAGMALMSVAGSAVVIGKKKEF